jgi:hypothetical protein
MSYKLCQIVSTFIMQSSEQCIQQYLTLLCAAFRTLVVVVPDHMWLRLRPCLILFLSIRIQSLDPVDTAQLISIQACLLSIFILLLSQHHSIKRGRCTIRLIHRIDPLGNNPAVIHPCEDFELRIPPSPFIT